MEKQVELSVRLQAVVDLVTKGKKVADVGCDHAYISIYMVEHKVARSVIAMDVNKGPLERARENIAKYGMEEHIQTRLSNGIQKLCPGEVDTLLIAGMGGPLMQEIIMGNEEVLEGIEELVLQPQSEIRDMRCFLPGIGFRIVEENMVLDEGKYYPMMRAVRSQDASEKKEVFLRYGEHLLKEKNLVLKNYLLKEKENYLKIVEKLQLHLTNKGRMKLAELETDIKYCEEALSYYEG